VKLARFAALAALTACASEAVTDIGGGSYTVTGSSARGVAVAREEAVELANEYCGKTGQKAVVQTFSDMPPQPLVKPTSSITFRCEH
jgi:hypothetical protein